MFGYACQSPVIEHMMKFSRKQPRFFETDLFFEIVLFFLNNFLSLFKPVIWHVSYKKAVPMSHDSQKCEMSGPLISHVKIM